jgi:hypothetical protein
MTAPLRWRPPAPNTVPEWLVRQEAYTRTDYCVATLYASIKAGHWTVRPLPLLPSAAGVDPVTMSARVLAVTEAARLAKARTYSLRSNGTGLAVAAAVGSAPKEKITTDRLPSPAGLMIFADPIGSDAEQLTLSDGTTAEIHTPIVAVSWSEWSPKDYQLLGEGEQLMWLRNGAGYDRPRPVPHDFRGIWMTFYAPRTADTIGRAPDDIVAVDSDGIPITASQSRLANAHFERANKDRWGPLAWHQEIIMGVGEVFAEHPRPGSAQQWAGVVYTAWQIMQQRSGKNQLVDIEEVRLPPAARKKAKEEAKRTGKKRVGDGVVRVVDLAAPVRPTKKSSDHDAEQSDGRRAVEWSCRWPVPPYRRETCTNPYLHHKFSDDARKHHEHREEIMPFKIKGPADKPLRVKGGTTFTFDVPPEEAQEK